jgi:hypothetical protein
MLGGEPRPERHPIVGEIRLVLVQMCVGNLNDSHQRRFSRTRKKAEDVASY